MTLKEALNIKSSELENFSESAKLDAQLLLCHACDIEQTTIIAHPEQQLTNQQLEQFNSALSRRINGEPIAYITGTKEFWSLDFIVNEHVLIPRPETELLVELTLSAISAFEKPRVLDLGTGSGAIAIAIAKECRDQNLGDAKIVASDVSSQALEIARQNAQHHATEITFIQSNWYENINSEIFDLIVCNPPYIADDDANLDSNVAKHEPYCALISDNNGLHDLDLVIAGASKHLSSTGYLILEHGFQQAESVQEFLKRSGFNSIQTYKDLAGSNRATLGQNLKMV
jgi:release factor glutamine methyltransferase